MIKKAVVVLPTYNEKDNIKTLIPKIFAVIKEIKNWEVSVLVSDDHSPDGTQEEIKKLQSRFKRLCLIEGKKEGLGKAYFRSFAWTIKHINPDVIFEMDADWSHDPNLIPKFLTAIEKGADFVIGARYIKGGSIPQGWEIHRKIFSILGNLIIRFGFMNLETHDWTSGFRAIKTWFLKEVLQKLKKYNGYVFQVALLDNAKKRELTIMEVPLNFADRKSGYSKINAIQYIITTLFYVFLHSSFVKFVIVGTIGFIIDFGISFILIEKIKLYIWLSTIISSETAIISNFFLNNFWSFSHKKIDHKLSAYLSKFSHFNFVSVGSILIQTITLSVATVLFPKQFWYIYKAFIVIFLIIPYSYLMYNFVIWRKKE